MLLALVVLVGAFLIYSQRTTKSDIDERVADGLVELQRLQSNLNQQRLGIDGLHAQINDLNASREAINLAIQTVTSNNIDWFTAVDALFSAQTDGVVFLSVSADPASARLQVDGLAREEGSKASLPTQFSNISETLDLQGIAWAEGSSPPVFTAAFRVGK